MVKYTKKEIKEMPFEDLKKLCVDCWDCKGCVGCWCCKDCVGCVGCWGLRDAKFHILNVEFSEDEYKEIVSKW